MEGTVTLRWKTGHIDLLLSAVAEMTATKLNQLLSVADNAKESRETIGQYLSEKLDSANAKTKKALESLIAVCSGKRKLTPAEKAAERIYKNSIRDNFQGVFQDSGLFCVCDGYRLVRFAEKPEFPECSGKLDTGSLIGDTDAYSVPLELPDVKAMKAAVKAAKGGAEISGYIVVRNGRSVTVLCDFGSGLPAVNVEYLADMLQALPCCTAYAMPGKENKPIYFTSSTGDGILLPCRKASEEDEKQREAEYEARERREREEEERREREAKEAAEQREQERAEQEQAAESAEMAENPPEGWATEEDVAHVFGNDVPAADTDTTENTETVESVKAGKGTDTAENTSTSTSTGTDTGIDRGTTAPDTEPDATGGRARQDTRDTGGVTVYGVSVVFREAISAGLAEVDTS